MYLESVPQSNIRTELLSKAEIRLPPIDTNRFYYFRYFTLFYRIYISNIDFASIVPNGYNSLNPSLNSDYNYFLPYTNSSSTTVNTSNLGTRFRDRNYWTLALENTDIENALSSSGQTIILDFSQTQGFIPAMTISNSNYKLLRSNGGGSFSPVPADRYFRDSPDLKASRNATSLINADTAAVSGSPTYAYAAFYIVATGLDSNFSPIYSTPAFIGVLRLPSE